MLTFSACVIGFVGVIGIFFGALKRLGVGSPVITLI